MKVPNIKVTPPGPKAREIVDRDHKYLASLTKTSPVVAKRGRGSVIEDVDGNLYVDFTCGIGVTNTGLCHPRIVEAIQKQAAELIHFAGTDFYYDIQTQLAKKLAEVTPGDHPKKVFFCNSGAEANEAAIKIAKYSKKRHMFIGFLGGFHGRTQGALAFTASKATQREGFFPMMPGVVHVPYAYCYRCPYKLTYPSCDLYCANIIEELYMKAITPPADLAGILFEPIQGEGGYIVPPKGWVERIAKIAKESGALLIDDEVQAGMGRTGKLWAVEHTTVVPDVITTAKGLGSGMPIGAAVFDARYDFGKLGVHSNTYGGNPVACASSLATFEVIEKEEMLDNARRMGEHMMKRLLEMQEKYDIIGDVRGVGLMQATEFIEDGKSKRPAKKKRDQITEHAYKHGLVLLPCGESTIRYIPALNIPRDLLDAGLDVLDDSIGQFSK